MLYALCSTFKPLQNHLPNRLPFNTAVNPGYNIKMVKSAAFEWIFLKTQHIFPQCMQVVIQLLFANIQVVFEKLEEDHLHFVEIAHLTKKTTYTINKVLQ